MRIPDFKSHMKEEHDMALDTSSTLLGIFRRPPQSVGGLCNLCFRHSNNLKIHVSRHLQQVALFAIPRADYARDDDGSGVDSDMAQDMAQDIEGDTDSFRESESDQNSEEKLSDTELADELESLLPDPYDTLGISKTSNNDEIRRAYRELALQLHPDKYHEESQKYQRTEKFFLVQQAYSILGYDESRMQYDAMIRLAELTKERFELRQRESPAYSGKLSREDVKSWSPEHVCEYFMGVKIHPLFCMEFCNKRITGEILLNMDSIDRFAEIPTPLSQLTEWSEKVRESDSYSRIWTEVLRLQAKVKKIENSGEVLDPNYTRDDEGEVPEIAESTWDLVTNKFSQARKGQSDPPPTTFANGSIVDPSYSNRGKDEATRLKYDERLEIEVERLRVKQEEGYFGAL